jgi:hypothetical protein
MSIDTMTNDFEVTWQSAAVADGCLAEWRRRFRADAPRHESADDASPSRGLR